MTVHPFIAVFVIVWFTGIGAALFVAAQGADVSAIGMLLFGILLVCGGFYPEALIASRKLREQLGTS